MTTRNVTNHHSGPLEVAGVVIPAGATAAVPGWEIHGEAPSIKSWIELEIISVAKGKVTEPVAGLPGVGMPGVGGGLPGVTDDTRTDEEKTKDALIIELQRVGGPTRTRATTVESLQKQIEKQNAANSADK